MTSTLDTPVTPLPDLDELRALESSLERRSVRRDNWTIMMSGVAAIALIFSVFAIGFGVRAINTSKSNDPKAAKAAAPVAAPAVPAPATPVPPAAPAPPPPASLTSVTLTDMTVTPSSTVVPSGKYTVTITNTGMMAHELLVFRTDIAPAGLPIGADGKVAEEAPGFKTSDGDNLEPGASQSRVIDLTQPGIYLFVCNLPGHFSAGMHTTVTVK